jgi:hypothetical protein
VFSLDELLAQARALPLADADWPSKKWYTGRFWEGPAIPTTGPTSERIGPLTFLIAARGDDDPERSPRGTYGVFAWKEVRRRPVSWWRPRILKLLRSDDRPRTFNAILVELSNTTGDMGFGTSAEQALWDLVEQGKIAHTYPTEANGFAAHFVRLHGDFGAFPWQV